MDYGILIQSTALGVVAGTNSSLKFREANLSKTHIPENFLLFPVCARASWWYFIQKEVLYQLFV